MTELDPYPASGAEDPPHRTPRTSGAAIASLVLGIVGLVAVPLVASVLAIILGRSAQSAMKSDPDLGGEGLARAGIILGWIGVALVIVGVLLFVLVAAATF